jgi:hypothetical protein
VVLSGPVSCQQALIEAHRYLTHQQDRNKWLCRQAMNQAPLIAICDYDTGLTGNSGQPDASQVGIYAVKTTKTASLPPITKRSSPPCKAGYGEVGPARSPFCVPTAYVVHAGETCPSGSHVAADAPVCMSNSGEIVAPIAKK